jgi:hypothetical protein
VQVSPYCVRINASLELMKNKATSIIIKRVIVMKNNVGRLIFHSGVVCVTVKNKHKTEPAKFQPPKHWVQMKSLQKMFIKFNKVLLMCLGFYEPNEYLSKESVRTRDSEVNSNECRKENELILNTFRHQSHSTGMNGAEITVHYQCEE